MIVTAKEMREFEEGRSHGYSHPGKTHGWLKSVAWNHGLKAGQAEYWKENKILQAKAAYRRKRVREHRELLKPTRYRLEDVDNSL